jgi:hypothetical protein
LLHPVVINMPQIINNHFFVTLISVNQNGKKLHFLIFCVINSFR